LMSSARSVEASCGGSDWGMYRRSVVVSEASRGGVLLQGREGFSPNAGRATGLLERRDAVGGLDEDSLRLWAWSCCGFVGHAVVGRAGIGGFSCITCRWLLRFLCRIISTSSSSSTVPQQSDDQKLGFSRCSSGLAGRGRRLFSAITSLGTDINGPSTLSQVAGRLILRWGCVPDVWFPGLLVLLLRRHGCSASSTSSTPRRSTNVSILFLSFSGYSCVGGPFDTCAAKRSAWSLCCQQKYAAAPMSSSWSLVTETTAMTPSSSDALASMGLRQGRPAFVMPLHVVAGFRESERGSRDSGVVPEKAMFGTVNVRLERFVTPRAEIKSDYVVDARGRL